MYKVNANDNLTLKWFPSEYFYQASPNLFCLAVDPFGNDSRMVIGGSFMRQNMFIFDIANNKVGVVRSRCSDDPNMYVYDDPKYTGYVPPKNEKDNKTETEEESEKSNPTAEPKEKENEVTENESEEKEKSTEYSETEEEELNPSPKVGDNYQNNTVKKIKSSNEVGE